MQVACLHRLFGLQVEAEKKEIETENHLNVMAQKEMVCLVAADTSCVKQHLIATCCPLISHHAFRYTAKARQHLRACHL